MQRLLCFCFPEAALDTVDFLIFKSHGNDPGPQIWEDGAPRAKLRDGCFCLDV